MTPKPYKTKIKRQFADNLNIILESFMLATWEEDEAKMFVALLAEVHSIIYKKLENIQPEYSLKLRAPQALALRLLYVNYIQENKTYVGNRLHQISNEIHQYYF